jgi:hypothetical protein
MPAALSARSSSAPERPAKGRPSRSSSAPGASPITSTSAGTGPRATTGRRAPAKRSAEPSKAATAAASCSTVSGGQRRFARGGDGLGAVGRQRREGHGGSGRVGSGSLDAQPFGAGRQPVLGKVLEAVLHAGVAPERQQAFQRARLHHGLREVGHAST